MDQQRQKFKRYLGRPLSWYLRLPVTLARWLRHRMELPERGVGWCYPLVWLLGRCRTSRGEVRPEAPLHILVVKLDGIGDTVMALPALRLLRRTLPEARIDIVTRPCNVPLITSQHVADYIYGFEPAFVPNTTRSKMGMTLLSLMGRLRASRYTFAVEMNGHNLARQIALWAAPNRCVGVGPAGVAGRPAQTSLFERVTDPVAWTDAMRIHSIFRCWAAATRVLCARGCAIADHIRGPLDLYSLEIDSQAVDAVASWRQAAGVAGRYAAIHPRAASWEKNWPLNHFAQIADYLVEVHDLDVVITGAASERDDAGVLAQTAKHSQRIHTSSGVFSLLESAALYRNAAIVVSVDTAAMHLADAAGAPLVSLFLPWPWYRRHLPALQPESAVYPPDGSYPESLPQGADLTGYIDKITVEQVKEAVERIMARSCGR